MKKLFSMLLVIVLCLQLASCGEKALAVGDSAKKDGLSVTLRDAVAADLDDLKPSDGNQYLLTMFLISNGTDKDCKVNLMTDFSVECGGKKYSASYDGCDYWGFNLHDLVTISTDRQEAVIVMYEIPADAKEATITCSAGGLNAVYKISNFDK